MSVSTRISAHIDGIIGVTNVGTRIGALSLALFPVHHQLKPVAKLLSNNSVPAAVAEALPAGRVLRCHPSCAVVNVE